MKLLLVPQAEETAGHIHHTLDVDKQAVQVSRRRLEGTRFRFRFLSFDLRLRSPGARPPNYEQMINYHSFVLRMETNFIKDLKTSGN